MAPLPRAALLFFLFAGVCFGLGYPTLNRYDPRLSGGNSDARYYYDMAAGQAPATTGHWRYRVLVPLVARPFCRLAAGRFHTWDPALFGLLCANSLFCAASLLVLTLLAGSILGDERAGLLCALLYALDFSVANSQLAGLVDSAEALFLLLGMWIARRGAWAWLPVLAVFGAPAKETIIPLSTALLVGWRLGDADREKGPWLWIAAYAVVGLVCVSLVRWAVAGGWSAPWDIASSERAGETLFHGLRAALFSKGFLYTFAWLLPLGVWRLGRLPRPWVWGSCAAGAAAGLLGAWNGSGDNAARPLFCAVGPMLCASVALLFFEKTKDSAPS